MLNWFAHYTERMKLDAAGTLINSLFSEFIKSMLISFVLMLHSKTRKTLFIKCTSERKMTNSSISV